MLGDVEVQDATAMVGKHNEDEEDTQAGDGNGEEIDGDEVLDMVGQERVPGLGGRGASLGISLETVRSATAMPSLRSSPWILGAPHRGFAVSHS